MCSRHAQRYWKHGDPLIFHGHRSQDDRFWSKVDARGVCWEWTGWRDKDGYGGCGDGRAHRVAWTKLVGPVPEGLVLDHLCRNPPCVNPDHLEPVTPKVNTARGRTAAAARERWARERREKEAAR
jgi:hypothetical protein